MEKIRAWVKGFAGDFLKSWKKQQTEFVLMLLFLAASILLAVLDITGSSRTVDASVEQSELQTEAMMSVETEELLIEKRQKELESDCFEIETESGSLTDPAGEETASQSRTLPETELSGEQLEEMGFPFPVLADVRTWKDLKDFWKQANQYPAGTEPDQRDLLQEKLEEMLASYSGEWSLYFKNLSTGEEILINDQPLKSASVMKLFILGAAYKAIDEGKLSRTDEIVSMMNDMIVNSSNSASNSLLYRLGDSSYEDGIAWVNDFIREEGFSEMTLEYNGFEDEAAIIDEDNFNQVSAKDCGAFLEKVYRRNLINRKVCNEIEQMMLNQGTRYKIPKGLPEGVSCGNKTGEMDTVENDAAIVYADAADYILVILSNDWESKDTALTQINELSALVYEAISTEE